MDDESLEERLRAVERAVADGEAPEGVADGAALAGRVGDVEAEVEDVDDRLADVEAAVQALRGYVGAVRGVNRDVERRADAALARVERLEDTTGGGRQEANELVDSRPDADPRHGENRERARSPPGDSSPEPAADDRRERSVPGPASRDRRAASDGGDRAPHPIPDPTPRDDRSLLARVRAWL